MTSDVDVLIVGGGPVGASLALALVGSGLDVLLVEARATAAGDARTLAVSRGTALMLARLGVSMDTLAATPIDTIHVSQRGGFGRTVMRAAELNTPALGYVVSYAALSQALAAALPASEVRLTTGAKVSGIRMTAAFAVADVEHENRMHEVNAKLMVLADGGRSAGQMPGVTIEERDYRQSAVVAMVSADPAATTIAYERFTPSGPAALLPYRGQYALVWTTSLAEADDLVAMETSVFLDRLRQHFGLCSMRFTDVGPRAMFPLQLRYAKPVTAQRTVLVGNAAQALHPVAGQGFNLGMRDVQALAGILRETGRDAIGSPAMLSRYRSARRMDAGGGIAVTDFLARGFAHDHPLLRAGRGLGLAAMDVLPPVRRWLARKMMFGISG